MAVDRPGKSFGRSGPVTRFWASEEERKWAMEDGMHLSEDKDMHRFNRVPEVATSFFRT
jgi:hypothetical protein